MVAGLSKDSYVKSDRVDKRNLDTDSKIDYSVSIQTHKLNTSSGANEFSSIANDVSSVDFNASNISSISFRLRGLTPYDAPYFNFTLDSASGSVSYRALMYCTEEYQTSSMRLMWVTDIVLSNIAVGDSLTVKVNVNGDATHNPYERTMTYNFVEWTAPEEGGEG